MKQCTGDYLYKGYLIIFSEYRQEWLLEPVFENADTREINFANDFRDEHEGHKTIAKAKKYIRDNEKELRKEIEEGLKNY